jgi:CBS domain-containing protein
MTAATSYEGAPVPKVKPNLGKRPEEAMLTAADIMTTNVIAVAPDAPVREIAKLLYAKRISGVPVVEPNEVVVGIVSEGDLMKHVEAVGEQRRSWWLTLFADEAALARDYAKTHARLARDVMTSEVISVTPTASVAEIANKLERHRIKRVPVVQDGRLIGIVTRGNLLQALGTTDVSKPVSLDDRTIRERLLAELGAQPWAHMGMKNIVVRDGVVHLWGVVESEDERRALRVAAENTPGVKAVEDRLVRYPAGTGAT